MYEFDVTFNYVTRYIHDVHNESVGMHIKLMVR